jgi:hypothetical protein
MMVESKGNAATAVPSIFFSSIPIIPLALRIRVRTDESKRTKANLYGMININMSTQTLQLELLLAR